MTATDPAGRFDPATVATALVGSDCFYHDGDGPGSYGAVIRFAGEEQCLSGYTARTTEWREEVRAVLAVLEAVPRDRPLGIASAHPTGAIGTIKAYMEAVRRPPATWPPRNGIAPLERLRQEPALWGAIYRAARGRPVLFSNRRGLLRWRLELPRQSPHAVARASTAEHTP